MVAIKIVVVGASATGKSCLVSKYVDNVFYESEPGTHQATIGASFKTKTITIEGIEVTFNIWDTGGQQRYECFAPTFCPGAKVAIVCFDLNKESTFETAQRWVNTLDSLVPNCKVYMCGTQKDRVNSQQLAFSGFYARIHAFCEVIGAPFFETSAKTNEGIHDLFNRIASSTIDYMMEIESSNKHERKAKVSKRKRLWQCCPCNLT
ncbi:ras-related protein Rab-24-like [Panonychus citri]|uniref:ras-related protein Rab-24-like n=1 Tax=Panonychus citri TaxID=50023 RepID=UPI0023071A1D|nr:ras-related protein Rab-24-like [Panonychus citri]